MRILICDDEPAMVKQISEIIADAYPDIELVGVHSSAVRSWISCAARSVICRTISGRAISHTVVSAEQNISRAKSPEYFL